MTKRMISLLMAVVMLLVMLPVGVAEDALPEDDPTAQTETPLDDSVTVTEPATEGEPSGQTPDSPSHTDGDAPNTDEADTGDVIPNTDDSDEDEPNEDVPATGDPEAADPEADDPEAGEGTDNSAALPEGAIPIDETHFPDDNFRAWLTENCGPATADDGTAYFTAEQANGITCETEQDCRTDRLCG